MKRFTLVIIVATILVIAMLLLGGTAITIVWSKTLRSTSSANATGIDLPLTNNTVLVGTTGQYPFLQTATNCYKQGSQDFYYGPGIYNVTYQFTDPYNYVNPGEVVDRHYVLYVPSSFDVDSSYDLFVHFGGLASFAPSIMDDHEIMKSAEERGNYIAIVPQAMGAIDGGATLLDVFPSDTNNSDRLVCWNTRTNNLYSRDCYGSTRNASDNTFVDELIENVSAMYNIDKVLISGFSNGCGMTQHYIFGGGSYGDAAVMSSCSLIGQDYSSFNSSNNTIDLLYFHGTDDGTVIYDYLNASPALGPASPSAELLFEHFASMNHCQYPYDITVDAPTPISGSPLQQVDVWNFTAESCSKELQFYKLHAGIHSWYSGKSNVTLDFFERVTDGLESSSEYGFLDPNNYTVVEGDADGGFLLLGQDPSVEYWTVYCDISYLADSSGQRTADVFTFVFAVFASLMVLVAVAVLGLFIKDVLSK